MKEILRKLSSFLWIESNRVIKLFRMVKWLSNEGDSYSEDW